MVTMSVPNRSLCPTLKGWKWGYLVFGRKRLKPREFPWQRHHGYYLISFVTNISGVKFEEHCFCISRDILYSVVYNFTKLKLIIAVIRPLWSIYWTDVRQHGIYLFYTIKKETTTAFFYFKTRKSTFAHFGEHEKSHLTQLSKRKWSNLIGCYA